MNMCLIPNSSEIRSKRLVTYVSANSYQICRFWENVRVHASGTPKSLFWLSARSIPEAAPLGASAVTMGLEPLTTIVTLGSLLPLLSEHKFSEIKRLLAVPVIVELEEDNEEIEEVFISLGAAGCVSRGEYSPRDLMNLLTVYYLTSGENMPDLSASRRTAHRTVANSFSGLTSHQ